MLLSLLLWTTSVPAQDAPLTISMRASRLENAVPAIAEKTGLDLVVDRRIKDLVVIVKVEDRPVRSVLRLIGEQVNATWVEQRDGSLLLVRRPEDAALREAQRRALERQGIEAAKERIRREISDGAFTVESVERFVAELERVGKPPEDGRGVSLDGPRLASPGSLLAKHLFLTVPTDVLMSIGQGAVSVFTEDPNRHQAEANAATLAAFDQFWRNVQLFVDLKSGLIGDHRGSGIDKSLVELEMPSSGRGKTLASVRRWNNTITTSVQVYAANGERFTEGFTLGEVVLPPRKVPAALKKVGRTRFPVSPEVALVQGFKFGTTELDGDFEEGSEQARLLALLRDPEHHDPLSFLVTDMFFAWADELRLDLVAHLPALFDRYVNFGDTEFDLTRLWAELERIRSVSVEERDGALLVRPVSEALSYLDDGYAERLGRLNRGLARFEDRLGTTAQFLAETFKATGRSSDGQLELMKWERAGVIPQNWHQQGLDLLPLWHELTQRQRETLLGGNRISVRELTPDARAVVNGTVGQWAWSSERFPYTHLAMEPTEHFPTGVPYETVVVPENGSDVALQYVFEVRFRDGMREQTRTESLRQIAEVHARARPNELHPSLHLLSLARRTSTARVQTLKLTFVAPDGSSVANQLWIPLERLQRTDLSLQELIAKYLGG